MNASMFLQTSKSASVLQIPASKWGDVRTVDPIHCAMMKFHKYTFNYISVSKLNPQLISRQLYKVKDNNIRELYQSVVQPVDPKYGIPLPVLNIAHAYDLNELIVSHGQEVRAKRFKRESQRKSNINIDTWIQDNNSWRQSQDNHKKLISN